MSGRANHPFVCPAPPIKIFRFPRRANHLYKLASFPPERGAFRDRHERRAGRDELVEMICPTGKVKYFSQKGWTGNSQNSPSGKSVAPVSFERPHPEEAATRPSRRMAASRVRVASFETLASQAPQDEDLTMCIARRPVVEKQGPIRRSFSQGAVADGFCNNSGRWLWVPAFAGTTLSFFGLGD